MSQAHDTIAKRLALILTKLNTGAAFGVEELAQEFNVTIRTIQRDLNERFNALPLEKVDGKYSLKDYCLGKLNVNDIKVFAALSVIKGLYPDLQETFVADLLNKEVNHSYLIKGYEYEDVHDKRELFDTINTAIVTSKQLNLTYHNQKRTINPYKLVNTSGIWYLVGDEDGLLKTFSLSKIFEPQMSSSNFQVNEEFIQTIQNNKVQWFSQTTIEVILEVDKNVASYFLRRKLLPDQITLSETPQKLTLSTKVSYEDEILKIVRYWIPHIRIVSPEYLQEKLESELSLYLKT